MSWKCQVLRSRNIGRNISERQNRFLWLYNLHRRSGRSWCGWGSGSKWKIQRLCVHLRFTTFEFELEWWKECSQLRELDRVLILTSLPNIIFVLWNSIYCIIYCFYGCHVWNRNPTATIFKTTVEDDQFAPFVVTFSSRGPNPATPDILKVN